MRGLALSVCLLGCGNSNRTINQGNPDLQLNLAEDGGDSDLAGADLLMSMQPPPDLAGLESGTAYNDLSINADASGCMAGQTGATCANPVDANAGCGPVEDCVLDGGHGNGLDDDCNGKVDDGCDCTPGEVHRCFAGPPGKRGVGGCTDGTQTCNSTQEFGTWSDCVGSIGPSPEGCDGLDNDCNGCADDQLCCGGGLMCPAPNDARIAAVAPFSTKSYTGSTFFSGNAVSWTWTVEGGPCDKLFASSGFTPKVSPAPQSFKVMNGTTADPSIYFSLSGDYTVTMTVVDDHGQTYTCKWVQKVVAPGVRFELCWDHQGPRDQDGADLDLHVHRFDPALAKQLNWFGKAQGARKFTISTDDCFWYDCKVFRTNADRTANTIGYAINWGLATSALTECSGSPNGADWSKLNPMGCRNPRLDIDNILDVGVPENVNIDDPANNNKFRAMVHYWGQGFPVTGDSDSTTSVKDIEEHPIVNIYCGGNLTASYGQPGATLTGFSHGTGTASGQMWRVADVTAQVAAGVTTGCTVVPLHAPGSNAGYWVSSAANTDITY